MAEWTALVCHDIVPTLFILCCHPRCREVPQRFSKGGALKLPKPPRDLHMMGIAELGLP